MLKRMIVILLINTFLINFIKANDYYTNNFTLIHYDNENSGYKYYFNGCNSYEVGVHFISDKLQKFKDKKIAKVRVYIYELPDTLTLRFYNSDYCNKYNLIYSQTAINIKSYSWNDIDIDVPLSINNEELWVGLYIKTDNYNKPIIGLDNGPGFIHANLYKTDNGWKSLEIDKNWNIQIVITD
jgi:hypothetical protein